MSSEFLETYIDNADHYLETYIEVAKNEVMDLKDLIGASNVFRQRGVCTFLLYNKIDAYHANAMQSAAIYLFGIQKLSDSKKVISKDKSFFDAIGSSYYGCAEDIAKNSAQTWKPDYEYEEDFLFVNFLIQHFFLDGTTEECQAILSKFESVLEGGQDIRLSICNGFLLNDNSLFESSLHEYLQESAENIENKIDQGMLSEEQWAGFRYFTIEGLALLKLAERKSFKTGQIYLRVPSAVRKDPQYTFDPNSWQQLHYSI